MTPNGDNPEFQTDEVLPADEQASEPELLEVLPPPKPPHPNLGWSLLWCLGILATLYGTIFAAIIVMFIGREITSRIRGEKKDQEEQIDRSQAPGNEKSPSDSSERKKIEEAHTAARMARLQKDLTDILPFPMFLGEVVTTLLAVLTLRIFVGKKWMRVVGLRPPSPVHVALVLIGLPAMLILPNMIHELAKEYGIPSFEKPEDLAKMIGGWSLGFGVLVIGVGPGLSEELWCRAFLGRGLVGNYGVWLGVLFTSVLFGIMHVDPAHAIATAVIGLWLHFTYLMSRSLVVPMVLHTLNNSIAVLGAVVGIQLDAIEKHVESATAPNPFYMQIYEWLDEFEKMSKAEPYVIAAGSAILLFTVAWALFASRTRLVVAADETAVAWRPDFPGVEYPPPGSVTKIYRPWPGWLASALVLVGILAFTGSCWFAYSKL